MHAVRTPMGVVFTPRADVARLLRATFAGATVATRTRSHAQPVRSQAFARTA